MHSPQLPVCPLVLDAWLPRVTPGQRVSKTPQMSLAELEHPYDMLNLSPSSQDILTKCLLHAIKTGLRIGHTGFRHYTHARNLSSAFQHPEIIDQVLAKERVTGRILGPFTTSPIYPLHCSGLGAIPKRNGKWRMVMHLSAPAGRSINDSIHPDEFSIYYSSVDDAVAILLHLGKGALMAKIDLKSAFRMIPVHCSDWDLLGMHWRRQYYVDTCLPFGLRSAPFLFNEYATAIEWIMTHNYQLHHLMHYLDDFFLAAPPQSFCCQRDLDTFLQVASKLGVPVAMEKVEGPLMAMSFLGLILDSVKQEIRLPPDKLAELMHELNRWSTRRKATKRELLSLIGKLFFGCESGPSGPSLPALPRHTCINCGTPASSDPPKCQGTCRHHLVADVPANLEQHCQVYRSELSAGCGYGRLSFHPIPCGSRDRPPGRKVIDEGKRQEQRVLLDR